MSRPANLLVLMSDEHQARALGCAGHPFVKTPTLDRLARRGTRFAQACTPCPICVPARAAFATGRYVHETRLWDNAMPYTGAIPGWGQALQSAGIPVESIGKLHYRSREDPAGFDVEHIPMMVAGGTGMVWASIRREDQRVSAAGRMLGDYIGPGTSKYTDYDAEVTRRTIDWLSQKSPGDDPWCLYVGLVAPHFPLVCPMEFYNLYRPDQMPAVKLHPGDGYARHPWVELQNAHGDNEAKFRDADERLRAMVAYYGLCSWLDFNIGAILDALDRAGLADRTNVIYTSDHGDNLGARGLWGKSNLYLESVAVPMIAAGPDWPEAICDTPVSLLDLSAEICAAFGTGLDAAAGVKPLREIAAAPPDPYRVVFSEYHAVGSVSGAFMVRRGRWKYHHYVGFAPELFDLQTDPEELRDLAPNPGYADIVADMERQLRAICDPEATDALAFADQDAMIAGYGGREAALKLGARGATPPPI